MPKYADLDKFTRPANYAVDVPWSSLQGEIERYIKSHGLEINPEFQRHHVWTSDQSSKFVEFVMKGGRSANNLYFNHPGWMKDFRGHMILVDGRHRLSAVLSFLSNELPAFGYYLNEYEDRLPTFEWHFRFHINDLRKESEVIQWYLDINTGGVVHNESEIQKAVEIMRKLKEEGK